MKNLGSPSRNSRNSRLLKLLTNEFHDAEQAYALFDEFLRHEAYDESFCLRLLAVARRGAETHWELRRLAILMLEHQILRIPNDNPSDFDFILTQLKLKSAPGLDREVVASVLREGYSTTNLRRFIPEFRRKLARLNRVHDKIKGRRTSDAALLDFIELSRQDCKLTLARYLFTAEEVIDQILRQLQVTDGVKDLNDSQPFYVEAEMRRAINRLPDFEASILNALCENSCVYWVAETTSSELNSLVEYPLTTVVLVVKPPGSDIEFEIKRAGRRGRNSLNVVYAREGYTVPPSHRLDGGSMQWLLRYEANSASRFGFIYRLVHEEEAPLSNYISRSNIYGVPVRNDEVQTLTYFTDPRIFGSGYRQMRVAMKESVEAFKEEDHASLPDLPGDLGLSAHFIGHVTPGQAILSGTTSFRLDKLAAYLSGGGPERYFTEGLQVEYSKEDARRLADAALEEVLGAYKAPDMKYQSHDQYLAAAFRVAENRESADRIYESLLRQIAKCWGTLLALRGYSRGESFVARNVGLKSFWDEGRWKVKLIFMDHDALAIADSRDQNFYAQGLVPYMALDETYIWGRSTEEQYGNSEVGCLRKIYRIGDAVDAGLQAMARAELKDAYKKTQHQLKTNPKLRQFFDKRFVERLLDWDTLVEGYLRMSSDKPADEKWEREMRKMLAAKGYGEQAFERYLAAMERNRAFLVSNAFLFEGVNGKSAQAKPRSNGHRTIST
jgi:hypothetical protein